jgi:NAD(P)-dependent dehydrogenase (short-subunit alcohol dehydrogenase family)
VSLNLAGRNALVTGGSRGLGREMILALAEAGADVMIVSRKLEACAELASEVESRFGRRAVPHACHVGRWNEIGTLVDTAYAEFGSVDILINNAGMSPLHGPPREVPESLFDKVLDVNLKGPFRLAALVGQRMRDNGRGSIINISSTASVMPRPDYLVYAAAKAGLNALTIAFARAYGPQVRVNTIMAGPFLTDVSKAWDMDAFQQSACELFALRRAGLPQEIVGAALYLAADASSYTTGAVIRVDGGSA